VQTKRQIQELLAAAGVRPIKQLGQHFLIDLNLMRLLIDSANIHHNDVVLEVGCGTGSLTEAISEKAGHSVAIEYDQKLAEIAKTRLQDKKNVEIISSDILESKTNINHIILKALERARAKYKGRILLVANLPYNVASPVMLNLLKGPTTAEGMYVTVQKEIADRMRAEPGSSDYGTLSIYLGATGEVKMIRVLKPTVFWPRPKVDSAMVSFIRKDEKVSQIQDMLLFSEIVKLFMNHRRKMLKSCAKSALLLSRESKKGSRLAEINNWAEIFERCSIDSTQRPEQLPPQGYVAVANQCHELFSTR
jgi:16S rRNA (adenine1518-N6/adenine1519-N6)-dimethyltransferase